MQFLSYATRAIAIPPALIYTAAPALQGHRRQAMAKQLLQKLVQSEAYRLVLLQLLGVIVLSFLAWPFRGATAAVSILAGGAAYVLPNLLFVWRVFRYAGAHQMTQFVFAFFVGEMFKLILSAILFLVVVKTLPVSLLSVLIGFISAIISFWIACMWLFTRKAAAKQEWVRAKRSG